MVSFGFRVLVLSPLILQNAEMVLPCLVMIQLNYFSLCCSFKPHYVKILLFFYEDQNP